MGQYTQKIELQRCYWPTFFLDFFLFCWGDSSIGLFSADLETGWLLPIQVLHQFSLPSILYRTVHLVAFDFGAREAAEVETGGEVATKEARGDSAPEVWATSCSAGLAVAVARPVRPSIAGAGRPAMLGLLGH